MKKLRKIFLQGLLVSLPAALTAYVLYLFLRIIYDFTDIGLLFLPREIRQIPQWALVAETTALAVTVALILGVGFVARTLLGRAFQAALNFLMDSIPIVRSIYGPLKQFMELVFSKKNQTFSRPVMVPFPHPGRQAIGFLTGTAGAELTGSPQEYYKVFVPTVPNPTSGFLILFRKEDVTMTTLSTEDAMRLIISGGILH